MAPGRVTPTLSGALTDCRPLVLLCFLAETEKTGVLEVQGRRSRVTLWLQRGAAVAAETDSGADLVGMARPFMADPDFARKVIAGDERSVRPCTGCNEGCRTFEPTATAFSSASTSSVFARASV